MRSLLIAALFAASVCGQYSRGVWSAFGGDPQRTGWNKTETEIVTVQACISRDTEIFKNLPFGPGYWVQNLAVYMFEGIASPVAARTTGQPGAIGA